MRRTAATTPAITTPAGGEAKRLFRFSAVATVAALIVSGAVALPAAAVPLAQIPANAADWATTPYSPLPAADVPIPGNNVNLTFDGGAVGGLPTGADVETGFTMVQPSSADATYYVPGDLTVGGGKLTIEARKGIAYLNNDPGVGNGATRNQQDNTLGVGVNPNGKIVRISTTVYSPTSAGDSSQGGIWFGPNDDNYVKLVVLNTSGTNRQIQIAREINAASPNVPAGTDQINLPATAVAIPVTTPVNLVLTIDSTGATPVASGTYQIGTGAVTNIGPLPLPANFVNGALVSGSVDADSFTGLFATRRNMPATGSVPFTFDGFAVTEVDTTAPGAPTALEAETTPSSTELSWTAPADNDVVGYRVYRSATTPVIANAANLISGATPSAGTTFEDSKIFVDQEWNYAVYAVDGSGNVSAAAATVSATTPAPEGDAVLKVDFTTPLGEAVDGYIKDAGAAYSDATGFGWLTADDNTPFNFGLNARVRVAVPGISDPRLLSLIHLQYGDATNASAANGIINEEGVWEHVLPNGRYNVVVAVGDTTNANDDSTHSVEVEGVSVISGFQAPPTELVKQGIAEVEVTDGKLTLASPDGTNTKISFLEVYELEVFGPDAPADFGATLGDDGESVDLSWSAVEDAVGYNVYRSESSPVAVGAETLIAEGLTATEFTDTTVQAGSTYYYVVVALGDGIPASSPSSEESVEIPEPVVAPDAPSGVTATAGEQDITVSWTASDGATGYKVFRGESPVVATDGSPLSGATPISATQYVDTSVTPGVTYHYVVVAVGEEGLESNASAAASATVVEVVDPGECEAGDWTATYFNGTSLAGAPVTQECIGNLNKTYASGNSPIAGIGSENWSASYVTKISGGAGTYTFNVIADDNVRLYIDNELVINRWSYAAQPITTAVSLGEGVHDVRVEFAQARGGARISVDYWVELDFCDSAEWSATYFDGRELSGAPVATECLNELKKTYANGVKPVAEVPAATNWSARYKKSISDGAGTYTFSVTADDAVRVFVDGETIIDRWSYGTGVLTANVNLDAGSHTVEVEFAQHAGGAKIDLDYVVGPLVCVPTVWSASYYVGKDLAGVPVATRCLTDLSETYAPGVQPVPELPSPNMWSARYTKTIDVAAGTYVFSATADDNVRVYIDGQLVVDRWAYGTGAVTGTVTLTEGSHDVEVRFAQHAGVAQIALAYSKVAEPCTASQWSASYFAGRDLPGAPVGSECLNELDKTYAANVKPISSLPSPSNWSARYSKTLNAGAGTYTFTATADDAVRIFVDGNLVIDRWAYGTGELVGSIPLTGGDHLVVVEFAQHAGGARIKVDYERFGIVDETAPDAPTELAVHGEEFGLALNWTASGSSDTAGYNVYRGTSAGVTAAPANKLNTSLLTETGFVDNTVQLDTTYYYVVTAVDGADNESEVSNEAVGIVESIPDTEAPLAPTGLAVVGGDTVADLTWTASESEDTIGYLVYRATQPGVLANGQLVSGAAPITATTFSDTTVTNGTTYFYTVLAEDLAGNKSAASEEVIVAPRVPNTTDIKVDFTETNGVPVAGYVADWGQAYGSRTSPNQGTGLTYGWIDSDGHELSLVSNGRVRTRPGIDPRLNSLMHMQYGDVDNGLGTNGIHTPGAWEIAVADGIYEVTVAVGDQPGAQTIYDSRYAINVEDSVAIESFQATAANEFSTATTVVGVFDGRLTIDALGGMNTKIGYVTIKGLPFDRPVIERPLPLNRALDASVTAGVSATIKAPYAGFGIDPATMQGNVKLFKVSDGSEVPGSSQTSGGSDTMNFAPTAPSLEANTTYRFVVTDGVKDFLGNPWVPFTSVFTTSAEVTDPGTPGEFAPLTNIAFEKVELPIASGRFWASFAFGPDGKLYGSTIGQGIFRYTVNPDGTLSGEENLGYGGLAIVGLLFDKSATAGNLKLWITNTSANTNNENNQWASGISLLTGPNLENRKNVFTEMPRSYRDHLTNSMVYGPNDDIYVLQGSNTAAGDGDGSWGDRGEKLLTAALLHFDPDHARVQQAINDPQGNNGLSVKTEAPGVIYDPYAPGAPLKLYATGIRNAYDLVYHSNGHLYVATNGTAGGGNSPGVTYNAGTNTYTQVSAPGIPGFAQSNGRSLTDQCRARDARDPNFVPTTIPAIGNHPTQRDTLYDVVQGGYYGHPNPLRCEFVLHEGNDPANPPKWAGQTGTKYPSGVLPDVNYKGVAYDFEYNKSPNGTIEYKSNTFGGQMKGRIAIVRFSNNNDLIFLQADATGKILGGQTEVGVPGVPNTTMSGVGGFNDPLELVENPANGNIYVNQYNLGGNQQKLFLLRVPASQQAAKISPSKDELIFSAVRSNGSLGSSVAATKTDDSTVTVTNQSTQSVPFSAAIGGTNASEFSIIGSVPSTIAAGQSVNLQVRFTPGTTTGERAATLTLTGDTSTVVVGLYGLSLFGIEGGNEPPLDQVLGTLGHNVNVGWTGLADGMSPSAKGEEILEPLFVKAGTGSVTWKPLAQFAPPENLPFGWYTGNGTAPERHVLGGIDGRNVVGGGYQSLLPPVMTETTSTFDPGAAEFGFFYDSARFQRIGYTEDRLNYSGVNTGTNPYHRARIYPAKNRSGVLIPNSYIVAFEDADNGDFQDYVFLVSGIKPKTDTGSGGEAIKVDFTTATGDLATGYIRDYGQAFGPRTGAGQGSGLTYGWKDLATENDVDLSVGGTTPGNARDRNSSQADGRLDSFMHMQPSTIAGTFNGTRVDAFWEIAVPNGTYNVTVGVGDPNTSVDAESHTINIEGINAINGFVPTGAVGANTKHTISTRSVTVSDGFLTVDPIGGTNTKIGFIDIEPVSVDPGGDDPSDGAQVKVTFQLPATPVPAGWTADTGAAFDATRGYGWLNAANNQPANRTDAVRYRPDPTAGIAYPDDARQRGFVILDNETVTTITDGVWEYAVPNGQYEVAASVGDSAFINSTHTVLAEGQPVINGYVPTNANPFQVGVRTVTVTDGRLTVTSGGINTKVNWVSIKGDGLTPAQPTIAAQIDFRPAATTAPAGWTADNGLGYTAARGYGWLVDNAPFDRSNMTRFRNAATPGITYPSDNKLQTLILMQNTTTTGTPISGGTVGVWEYDLPAGEYTVTASAGDSSAIDSVHSMTAEGEPLITGFSPTNANPFTTGTATVVVTDGKLTINPTGVNTKINWITITGKAVSDPLITVRVNGAVVDESYEGGAATVTADVTVGTGSTLASLTYSIGGGVSVPYTGPITLADEANYEVAFTAVDSQDRSTTKNVTLEVLDIGGDLTLVSQQVVRQGTGGAPLPGLYDDLLVMHRINSGVTTHTTTESGTVNLTNTGAKKLRVTALTLSGPQAAQFELTSPPTLPLFIEPGQSVPVTVKFIGTGGSTGVRSATLNVASSDLTEAITPIRLRGGYMPAPEGNNELTLGEIFTLFGSTTNTGSTGQNLGNGSENPGAPMDGEEVRSLQWKRLDTSQPVRAVQLAAFHGCCGQQETINVGGTSATHAVAYGQAVYPLKSDGTKTTVTVSPAGNFAITVNGQSTNNTNYMAVKLWPVKDAAGKVVPGAWFLGHDYISSPNQCGVGATNCDYQDNVYLITNMLPVASSDTTAPAAPGAVTGSVVSNGANLSWPASTDADLIGYRIERASAAAGPWTAISGTGIVTGTTFRDTAPLAIATSHYRVVAVDSSGNATAGPAGTVDTSSITISPIRINAGGGQMTIGGQTWIADPSSSVPGYRSYTNPSVSAIAGTTNDALYYSTRSDNSANWGYDIPVPNGTYQVRLHFVEVYYGAPGGGANNINARRFSINLEGGPVERANYSILQDVGPVTLDIEEFTVTVTDGNLDIDFSATANQPAINALEIIPVQG